MIKKKGGRIGMEDLKDLLLVRRHLNKEEVMEALRKAGWNKSEAARILGIHRRQLYQLLFDRH